MSTDNPTPDPEPTPEPTFEPQATPQPTPETPAEPTLRDMLSKATDWDLSGFESDDQLVGEIRTLIDSRDELEQYARMGRQVAPHFDKVEEFVSGLQQPPKEPEPEETAFSWDAPKLDRSIIERLERDDRGFFVAPANMPELASYASQANKAIIGRRELGDRLLDEFPDLTQQVVTPLLSEKEKAIREYVDQKLNEFQQSLVAQQQEASYYSEREKLLLNFDENGRHVVDQNGIPQLSPLGVAHEQYRQSLIDAGVNDPNKLLSLTDNWLKAQATQPEQPTKQPPQGQQQPPTPDQPTEAPRDKKGRFLSRVGSKVFRLDQSRNGSEPETSATEVQQQAPDADFGDAVESAMQRRGL